MLGCVPAKKNKKKNWNWVGVKKKVQENRGVKNYGLKTKLTISALR